MSARTWWSAKADPKPAEEAAASGGSDLPMEELLDTRIDQEGRLSRVDPEGREHLTDFNQRTSDLGAEELEAAVQKLSEGLEAIEKQSQARKPAARVRAKAAPAPVEPSEAGDRDFVTYSLDRLEARLEALSRRLQQRSEAGPPTFSASTRRPDPSLAAPAREDFSAQLAESRRLAEIEAARAAEEAAERARQVELEAQERRRAEFAAAERRREAELAAARREAEAADERRRSEVAEMRRQAEIAEARRQAELVEARRQAELLEARRQADAKAAEEHRLRAIEEERRRALEEVEAARLADLEEMRRKADAAEARQRAAIEDVQRQAEIMARRHDAEMAAALEHQLAQVESRIDALQKSLDENQIEPVRGELLELVEQITELSRGGRATAESLAGIAARLDQMELKLTAARNMAGNRLGDIQDRLGGLVGRLDELEAEIPGFDAIRVNQGAILERFDRMEGMVHRLASPDELFERVEGLKRQLQTAASQREVARIEEQLLRLADRVDALPDELSEKAVLDRLEEQLGGLATEFTEARRQRKVIATEIEGHLDELAEQIRQAAESGRTPDLSGIEERLSKLTAQVAADRSANSETLTRLEQRITALTDAIENQYDDGTTALLESLTQKLDALSEAVDAQDSSGARRDIVGLGQKFDELSERLAAEAEHLSSRQIGPIEQRLADIEERIATLAAKSPDPRVMQTQIDAIVSRLELLKGRSIDPALLNDLFGRVDAAMRALPEERFERIEQKLEDALVPAERFDRLEKRIAEAAAAGAATDRFTRLEKRLDEIGSSFAGDELLTQDDLAELRSEIATLRRDFRSIPGFGQGDDSITGMMRSVMERLERLPIDAPVTLSDLEVQMDRLTRLIESADQSHTGFAAIENSLKALERRLEDTQQAIAAGDGGAASEMQSVAGMARSLSEDVSLLKSSAEMSERKTRDAIDAVQSTLEAVVKRMAFLERDADANAERPAAAPIPAAAPVVAAASSAPAFGRMEVAEEIAAIELPEPSEEEGPAELPSPSLFSRLTSRQLLRRATGGRADSFSPEPDEAEDASDLPLEPGTDSPLNSSLTGAPSSNTEFMSGARKGRPVQPYPAEPHLPTHGPLAAADDDDFLAAARRAARAAAREADSEEPGLRAEVAAAAPRGSATRVALFAAGIAAILAIATIPFLRPDVFVPLKRLMSPSSENVDSLATEEPNAEPDPTLASTPSEPMPSEAPSPQLSSAEPDVAPPASMTAEEKAQPEAPAPSLAAEAPATPQPATEPEQPTAPTPSMATAEPTETPATPSAGAPADSAATAEAQPGGAAADGAEVAAVSPAEPVEATEPTFESTEMPAPVASTALPPLPETIGPQRLRDAARSGDTAAAFEVASRYAEGREVLPDMPTAVLWYEHAAELGLPPAQYRLGSIYEKGLGVQKDLQRAQMWYRRAADAGNVKAMHNLAVLYAEGAGGEPSLERAAELFQMAAERGVRDSQFNLAILYARGIGVPQNLIEAYKWFGIAANSGDEESAKRRDIIGAALPERDRAQAERAVATFQPTELTPGANEVIMPEGGWSDSGRSTSVEVDADRVALVQKLLAENGYDPGPADGLLGSRTVDAISEFQGKAGLPKTGQIDDRLVAALQSPAT